MKGYRELKVWQLGVDISIAVYSFTVSLPKHETYGLSSQMRRAAVSIPSNLAEGHSRSSTKDLIRFVNIARGSLAELETQLIIAGRLDYGEASVIKKLLNMTDEEGRMLSGYHRSLESKL